jgi:phage gp16-like protein
MVIKLLVVRIVEQLFLVQSMRIINMANSPIATDEKHLRRVVKTGQSKLGWSDDIYQAVLMRLTGKVSSTQCNATELDKVLVFMRSKGFKPVRRKAQPAKAKKATGPLLKRINALLIKHGRPSTYADSIAKNRFNVDKLEWLDYEQLKKIMQMLSIDDRRRGKHGT